MGLAYFERGDRPGTAANVVPLAGSENSFIGIGFNSISFVPLFIFTPSIVR